MKLKFEYDKNLIEFNVIHKKRKTICIKVEEGGVVNVSAPMSIDNKRIIEIVSNRGAWILDKQREMKKLSNKIIERRCEEGSTFMYMGEEYPLHLNLNSSRKLIKIEVRKLNDRDIEVFKEMNQGSIKKENLDKIHIVMYTNTLDEEKNKEALKKWYKEQTYNFALEKIEKYKLNFKDEIKDVKVKEQKRRWASCTGDNRILFNWRCSMAKEEVMEYIVVHEMCHMDYKDHSKMFWKRVEEVMPSYKIHHDWLKVNGMNMRI